MVKDQLDQFGVTSRRVPDKVFVRSTTVLILRISFLSLVYQQSSNGKHGVGESDFVIATRMQVFSSEVKGGGIRYDPSESNAGIPLIGMATSIKSKTSSNLNYQFRILIC